MVGLWVEERVQKVRVVFVRAEPDEPCSSMSLCMGLLAGLCTQLGEGRGFLTALRRGRWHCASLLGDIRI